MEDFLEIHFSNAACRQNSVAHDILLPFPSLANTSSTPNNLSPGVKIMGSIVFHFVSSEFRGAVFRGADLSSSQQLLEGDQSCGA
ncbi:hypothetical protein OIU79_027859 [Salix purpurea]|uniref:Uncharacterized protein n=1 Tax=Salix purpurea TaxID=77065 RepID=A0A9Q0VVV9_SALPP|nr:hypothetical protein OIU79_027859 [Salix purpurea]